MAKNRKSAGMLLRIQNMLLLRVKVGCDASCYPNQGQRRQELAHLLHPSIGSFVFLSGAAPAGDDPPPNLTRLIAARETETAQAQSNYTYRQTVTLDELKSKRVRRGAPIAKFATSSFRPSTSARSRWWANRFHADPSENDRRRFSRHPRVQPFLLTKDQAFLYETQFRGEENMDGVDCFVVQIRPRQILDGQRLFDGMLWVSKKDYSVIRSEGQAVPQIHTLKTENLFPHFTTCVKSGGRFLVPGDDLWRRHAVFPRRRATHPADHPLHRVPPVRRRLQDHVRQIRPEPALGTRFV
jgi:hypothetical protein